MIKRFLGAAVVGALVLGTGVLVVTALRPADPPRTDVVPIEMGAVAVVGDHEWRWTGPSDCNADADVRQVESRVGTGEWAGVRMPLSNVLAMQFGDRDTGVAIGLTSRLCGRGVALTRDGGRSWHYKSANPALLDAWWAGERLWGIERGTTGPPTLTAFTMRDNYRLVPVRGIEPATPCDVEDGTPTQVAFFNADVGLLLCEQALTGERLLSLTSTASEFFERLTDRRQETGFSGEGQVLDMDVAGEESVWALFEPGPGCVEGQVRRSDDQGETFDRLPCVSKSAEVDEVFDVAFANPNVGTLLGERSGELVMLQTEDAGTTWSPHP